MMETLDSCLIIKIPESNYFNLTYSENELAWFFLDCIVTVLPRSNILFYFGYKPFVSCMVWISVANQQSPPEFYLHS